MWLPNSEKISKISLFILTECTNVTDTWTDRQTPHDGIGRACIATRGKNYNNAKYTNKSHPLSYVNLLPLEKLTFLTFFLTANITALPTR